jgi:hypothetical protein
LAELAIQISAKGYVFRNYIVMVIGHVGSSTQVSYFMAGPKITHWILEGSTRNIVATFPYDIEYERTNGVDLKTILCLDWTGDVNQIYFLTWIMMLS